jgi:hypothetical protein
MMHRLIIVAIWLAFITASGCTGPRAGYPNQSFDTKAQIRSFEAAYPLEKLLEDYNNLPSNDAAGRLAQRDRIIMARLTLIDLHYTDFVQQFSTGKKDFDTGADVTVLTMNAAGALIESATTKGILHGVAGVVTGTRLSVDKNYFYERTIPVLIGAMDAKRREALIPLYQGLERDETQYPLARAWSDLNRYYFAGTFDGALQSIQAESAIKQDRADKRLEKFTRAFNDDPDAAALQDRLIAWLNADRSGREPQLLADLRDLGYEGEIAESMLFEAPTEDLSAIVKKRQVP